MPSIYEQSQQFRAALIRRDAAAIAYLTEQYKTVYARIIRALAVVNNQISEAQQQGVKVSQSWLAQQWRYQLFLQQLDAEFRQYSNTLNNVVTARQAFEYSQGAADASAMVGASFARLPVAATEAIIGNLRAGSPLATLLDSFGAVASQRVADALRDGVALGYNPRKVAREVRDALGVPLHRALLISRTESLRAYRQSTLATYQASEEVTGYYWLATKSPRTCLACLALDGHFFPKDKPQAFHPSCRCTTIPGIEGVEPSKRETAAQWFAGQPDAVKREMMGASAFEAFKAGKVSLRDFVGRADSRKWGSAYYQLGLKRALAGEGKFPATRAAKVGAQIAPRGLQLTPEQIDLIKRGPSYRNEEGIVDKDKIAITTLGLGPERNPFPPFLQARARKIEAELDQIALGRPALDRERLLRAAEALREEVKREGKGIEPIRIAQNPDGSFVVSGDGNHRIAALKLMGYRGKVPALAQMQKKKARK